jgi:hypothetical protein
LAEAAGTLASKNWRENYVLLRKFANKDYFISKINLRNKRLSRKLPIPVEDFVLAGYPAQLTRRAV